MNEKLLQDYARVLIEAGVNLQPGEVLCMNASLTARDLVLPTVKLAYERGADRVYVDWHDDALSLMDLQLGKGRKGLDVTDWEKAYRQYMVDKKVCYINMLSGDPELFAEVDSRLLAEVSRARHKAHKSFFDAISSNIVKWCIVGVPDAVWAAKVFPSLPERQALEKLWEYVAHTMRLDTPDAVAAWHAHNELLKWRARTLNEMNLRRLHYTNALGTDLWLGLPEGYIFEGGCEYSAAAVLFNPNMPTEEIFSAPDKYRVDGKAVASMPLYYNGVKVRDFGFVFENGRIVDYWAAEGIDVLKGIIDTDEGSHYLGEVALVPYDSPISNLHTLFLETLFDENASCHLAIGAAYPSCVQGGLQMDEAQLEAHGVNNSYEHVDFMIGTPDLSIVGETRDGKSVVVFEKGNFVF